MKTRALASTFCAGIAVLLSACAKEPISVTDVSEIASHRSGTPIIRGADHCVDEISRRAEIGYGGHAHIRVRVDEAGQVRFVGVDRPTGVEALPVGLVNLASADCQSQIALAVEGWRYRPFERGGSTVEVELVERALMLPAERWRVPPRQFPRVPRLESVVNYWSCPRAWCKS